MREYLVSFAGDDHQPRRSADASSMFDLGYDTADIALAKNLSEAAVLKRITLERCRRLGLPSPYEVR